MYRTHLLNKLMNQHSPSGATGHNLHYTKLLTIKSRWQSINMGLERRLQPNHPIDHSILYIWPSLLIVLITTQRKSFYDSTGTFTFKPLPFKRLTESFLYLRLRLPQSIEYLLVLAI